MEAPRPFSAVPAKFIERFQAALTTFGVKQ